MIENNRPNVLRPNVLRTVARAVVVATAVALAGTTAATAASAAVNPPPGPGAATSQSSPIFFHSRRTDPAGDIYRVDPGANPVQLTFGGGFDGEPSANRGATKVAFTANRGDGREIYLMDGRNGSGQTRLTADTKSDSYQPSLSLDGTKIAFTRYTPATDSSQIGVMSSSGGAVTMLTTAAVDRHGAFSPAWSPDGTRIAFVGTRSTTTDIWTMKADGTDARQITFDGGTDPTWSPDGSKIAYSFTVPGTTDVDIVWTAVNNVNLVQNVTHRPGRDANPTWSPDGSSIAYEATLNSTTAIYSIPVNGGTTQVIGGINVYNADPYWAYPVQPVISRG